MIAILATANEIVREGVFQTRASRPANIGFAFIEPRSFNRGAGIRHTCGREGQEAISCETNTCACRTVPIKASFDFIAAAKVKSFLYAGIVDVRFDAIDDVVVLEVPARIDAADKPVGINA